MNQQEVGWLTGWLVISVKLKVESQKTYIIDISNLKR